jgi:S-adenosylmethionine:tRNA ribosyltransferase-isomerase
MHREYFSVKRDMLDVIRNAKARGGRILAVGTSAVRTIETLKHHCNGALDCSDYSPVNVHLNRSNNGACTASGNGRDSLDALQGYTDLFIHPGYTFAVIDGVITNFHLPRSTPLLLVSAFAGKEKIFEAYRQAMALSYRFYSYGDAMLIL